LFILKYWRLNINKIVILLLLLFIISCGKFTEQANQQFGDQHFKTAIALIELHKIRYKEYPNSLDELKYIGEWDKIIFSSVKYKKLSVGYRLDLINGWVGKPESLKYPDDFWVGLGLKESNIMK
jgi:hypothetical protein